MLALQPGEALPWYHPDTWLDHYRGMPHVAVSLAAGAGHEDVLTAVLQAAHLRTCLARAMEQQQLEQQAAAAAQAGQQQPPQQAAAAAAGRKPQQLRGGLTDGPGGLGGLGDGVVEACIAASKQDAERSCGRLMRDLQQGGWQVKPLLLSTSERPSYTRAG
jgi:hypothetical protein